MIEEIIFTILIFIIMFIIVFHDKFYIIENNEEDHNEKD